MLIRTTAEQDQEIHRWYRAILSDHYVEGCEPPGFILKIEMGHPSHFDIEGEAVCGSSRLSLGPVEVMFDSPP